LGSINDLHPDSRHLVDEYHAKKGDVVKVTSRNENSVIQFGWILLERPAREYDSSAS
jgi:hypothetical protein